MVDGQMEEQVERLLDSGKDGILGIVKAGDPVLRRRAAKASGMLSPGLLARLIEAMHLTMLDAPGVGLAGPQIGLPLAIAVVEDHDRGIEGDERERVEFPFHAIIDPVYHPVESKGERAFFEGCLSVPGFQAVRRRWLEVDAAWMDEGGVRHEERLHGWPARIFQHETDHLHGEIYLDKADVRGLTTYGNLKDHWHIERTPETTWRRPAASTCDSQHSI